MALNGTLRTWNDDRGFGFIAPTGGGKELFVHISAFPNDGSRPTTGEALSYELGTGKDGKPAAIKVFRQALGQPASYPASKCRPVRTVPERSSNRWGGWLVALVVLAVAGGYVFKEVKGRMARQELASQPPVAVAPEPTGTLPSPYRCDGRTHCSQMTSCAEAKYFIQHCPGTKMDSDNDGEPCEQQWCTGFSSR